MKTIIYILVAFLCASQLTAQNTKPGVRAIYHAKDALGKPLKSEEVKVNVTFATRDANGNKVVVYKEEFTVETDNDGSFEREIGATYGDLPIILIGKYKNVNFKDSTLCIRMDFLRTGFGQQWIIGDYKMFNPVPLAAQVLNGDNQVQKLTKAGDEISLSNGGGSVILNDDDPTNELQVLDYDEDDQILYLSDGNFVDLSSLAQFEDQGSQLSTDKVVNAGQFTTTDGHTDIQEGKISLRYDNGFDGIEMGVDDEFCAPFLSFIDCKGNSLGSFRMGPEGFKFYPE
jgi:hypothetical protein